MAETLRERGWLGNRDSGNNYPCGCRLDGLQTEEITVIRKEVPDGSFPAPVFVEVPGA